MTINSEPTQMAPTEMAGVAEAETQAAYAWALDYDGDEFPTQPTQRLTPRRITALALAISLARQPDGGDRFGHTRRAA